jgi:GTPase SAR1 family protein
MSVEEIQIKNPIDISKYNFPCDDVICETIPYPLPNTTFKMGIIGKSGIGKTNLLRNLTERMGKKKIYAKKFSNVFYISPSIKSMDKKPKLADDQFYDSLNDLPEILERIQNEDDKEGRTLLIMDDITNELKTGGAMGQHLKTIYQNNRHLGRPRIDEETGEQEESGAMSSIILSQRLNNLPRFLRSQITHWIIFDPRSTKSELDTIFQEIIHCSKECFNEILKKTFEKKFNFLFIDVNRSKIYNGFSTEYVVPNVYL